MSRNFSKPEEESKDKIKNKAAIDNANENEEKGKKRNKKFVRKNKEYDEILYESEDDLD